MKGKVDKTDQKKGMAEWTEYTGEKGNAWWKTPVADLHTTSTTSPGCREGTSHKVAWCPSIGYIYMYQEKKMTSPVLL